MLDFRNWTSSSNLLMHAIMPPNSEFPLNQTIWSRVIAKKWFSIRRSSTIFSLGISEFLSCFRRLGQNLRLHIKFRQIRTIRGWDICCGVAGRTFPQFLLCVIVRLVFLSSVTLRGIWCQPDRFRAILSDRMSPGPDKRRPGQVPARMGSGAG